MLNRRTFFGGLASIFPGLAFVGGKMQDKNNDAHADIDRMNREAALTIDEIRADLQLTATRRYRKAWLADSDEVISWIPVEERPPALFPQDDKPFGKGILSSDILHLRIIEDGNARIVLGTRVQLTESRRNPNPRWCVGSDEIPGSNVTHWAEMPKGLR